MTTRHLYLARHGAADAFGALTRAGRHQARLLGERLARLPVDVIWHSPLPRATDTAAAIADRLPGVPVIEAPQLIDHVPYVPTAAETPPAWAGFFDGYSRTEADVGHALASALQSRFGSSAATSTETSRHDTHEVVITHSYPIAWLIRDALDAPPARWLGLDSANAALTLIEHRTGIPPALVMFNDMSHLTTELRWTGFTGATRP